MGVDVPASQSHWLLWARLYAVMIPPLSWESWEEGCNQSWDQSRIHTFCPLTFPTSLSPQRQEEQHRHRPSPWRVMYNLFMGLLPLPRDPGAPEMEPN